jgi:hypothetical protein
MNITYTSTNNNCFNQSLGSIIIESIVFTVPEESLYQTYTIEWTGDFTNSLISNDQFQATLLPNGTYSFKLISTSSSAESETYTVTITSPEELTISYVKYIDYACSDTGSLYLEINGGVPPYYYNLGPYNITSQEKTAKFENIDPGRYPLSIRDSNQCQYIWNSEINIRDADISYSIQEISPPKLLNSFVTLALNISGHGPFNFTFINQDILDNIYIDTFETKYLQNISIDNVYTYLFNDILVPGTYSVTIQSVHGCSISQDITLPNIEPMTVNMSISTNSTNESESFIVDQPLPIFDTILVPYKLIINNSSIWQIIKNKTINDNLELFINDQKYSFTIYKIYLNKYCTNDNQIQILRLDNNPNNWYYYFYIAPGINLNANPELINAKIQLKHDDQTFDISFGLKEGNLDHENVSLIRGSFILSDVGYNQFFNGSEIDVKIGEPVQSDDKDYYIKNVKKNIANNIYLSNFVTILSFLEYFSVLNSEVYIDQTSCNINPEDYQYIINIKKLLKNINNFNNNNDVYIFNSQYYQINNNVLSLNIIGNEFILIDEDQVSNNYNIQYFNINKNNDNLLQMYIGSKKLENIFSVSGLQQGYYIVRIKDKYGNIPRFINYDISGATVNYDEHFLIAKKFIQNFNDHLLDKFIYGDILIFIGNEDIDVINNPLIPSTPQPPNIISPIPERIIKNIEQTKDSSNSNSLTINMIQNVKYHVYGPNNYSYTDSNSVKITNMVPGVYTIIGNAEELINNSLYQNETRINIEKNKTYEVYINFTSYQNSIFIKDI